MTATSSMPTSAPEPKRRTAPPFDVIVSAAAELFGSAGYANTSMQDVADRLGIAKPTLYVHAKSKLGLLEGVYDQVLTEGNRALDEAEHVDEPSERLRTFVRLWTETTIRRRPLIDVFFANETELPEHLVAHYRAWSAKTVRRIRAMITAGQEAGFYRADLDATTVAFAIISATQWSARWWREDGPLSFEDMVETHVAFVEGGLLAR